MEASIETFQRPALSASNSNGPHRAMQTPRESNGDESIDGLTSKSNCSNDYFSSSTAAGTQAHSNMIDHNNACSSSSPQPPQRQTTQRAPPQHPWSTLFGDQGMPTSSVSNDVSAPFQSMPNYGHSHHKEATSSSFLSASVLQKKLGMRRVQSGGSTSSANNGSSMAPPGDFGRFKSIDSSELVKYLLEPPHEPSPTNKVSLNRTTLVIDIRPSTSFLHARVRGSVNVCAPSTLLRRNGVTIERIEEEMLTSEADQRRFSGWRKGPQRNGISSKSVPDHVEAIARVVVLDTDTQDMASTGRPSAGGGGHCLAGMLRKFDQAGYDGALCWLIGGFEAFTQHVKRAQSGSDVGTNEQISQVLDTTNIAEEREVSNDESSHLSETSPAGRRSSAPNTQMMGDLRLPALSSMRTKSLVQPKGLPMEAFTSSSTVLKHNITNVHLNARDDGDGSMKIGRESGTSVSSTLTMSAANPFFDNIRQNRELQNGITERIPLTMPEMTESEARRLPGCLAKLRSMSESERADCLAQAFYEVERDERDRLMDTMQRHADESDGSRKHLLPQSQQLSSQYCAVTPGEDGRTAFGKANFPFSIAAALERGGENRYNNIWTYEHSRVLCPSRADYLNGSYIEPARKYGCRRRYIATQAPLPSTFDTFWSVVWQQNVHTICMVTREFESGRVQSHNYWRPKKYGSLQLELIEEVALDQSGNVLRKLSLSQEHDESQSGFNFGCSVGAQEQEEYATIQRRFWLSDESGKRRAITQFQYIAWPDYSVPDNAESLLVFMRLASNAQHTAELELQKANQNGECSTSAVGPMVVHCSAGVGRTGTYILIDAALDVFRRARWAQAGRQELDVWGEGLGHDGVVDRSRDTSINAFNGPLSVKDAVGSQNVFQLSTPMFSSQQQRKNLKRELSPSAMNLDARDSSRLSISPTRDVEYTREGSEGGSTSTQKNVDSPPPTRRSRPDETNGEQEGRALSSSPLSMSSGGGSYMSHLPFSAMGPDGPQTPSTALGRLSLSSAQSGTPSRSRHGSSQNGKIGADVSSTDEMSKMSKEEEGGGGGISAEKIQVEVMDLQGDDLVCTILQTIREQRMSMVQTSRQFVFAYWTILTGVVHEMRREEASFGRRR